MRDARGEFARRLKELRVPRGFKTARSLARALEIDENRYTRYERAEVEPDIDMILRICDVIGVSPNDLLLGPDEPEDCAMADFGKSAKSSADEPASNGSRPPGIALAAAAWAVSEVLTGLRQAHRKSCGTQTLPGEESPLADVGETGATFSRLMQKPFMAISELLEDPAVRAAPPPKAHDLRERIGVLVMQLKVAGA